MTAALDRRLAALETARAVAPARLSPEETEATARHYAALLDEPGEPDLRATAYWASVSLHQLATDYAVMVSGGPAPWE